MKKIEELNELYREADEADAELFAEQRSNILLIAGEHYTKRSSKFWNRVRNSTEGDSTQKLRLTKNHIQRITKMYINNIVSYCPGVTIMPRNEQELQDQKAATLHNSVKEHIRDTHKFDQKTQEYAEDYVGIGEVAVKLFWDPSAGELKGYEQKVDDDGQPTFGEDGQPEAGDRGVFSGDLVFERIFGFNLFRHPDAKSMDDSPFLGIRKMARIKEVEARLEASYEGEELAKKKRMLEPTKDDTYTVFDGQQYKQVKEQVMFKEYYYRSCTEYPQGYYYITVDTGILWEGELPLGIFPIFYAGFDPIQTTPRCRSMIKQLRPYQAEINRAASKIAEHQITLGDDKLIIANGSKISNGGQLPGIRALSVSGPMPQILPGRAGEQYANYMAQQISEMYQVAQIQEDMQEKGQQDPYTMLYQSMSQKKRFSMYSRKFERFLIDLMSAALEFKRFYCTEEDIIPVIGKNEAVNIREFKNSDRLHYQIKVEASTEDIESKFGKQLTLNHLLQYVGPQLKPDDIGKLIRQMPYANNKEAFSDLTLDYDSATNMILALDRGEQPEINEYDKHPYIIQKLTNRTRQADFRFLDPQIQQLYKMQIQQHMQMQSMVLQKLKQMESEFIPTGGYLVTLDVYVNDPMKPGVSKRARLPYEAVVWLIKQLESQGTTMATMLQMGDAAQAQVGMAAQNQMSNPNQEPSYDSVSPQGMPQLTNGQANPGG